MDCLSDDSLAGQGRAQGDFCLKNGGFDRAERNFHRRADLGVRKLFQQV